MPDPSRPPHAAFKRRFGGCAIAEDLVASGDPHWFVDLLSLWRPAGHSSGADGLRLAVRDGYLNFYRRGQSLARVSVVRGELRGELHAKYFSEAARRRGGQTYGRLLGSRVQSTHDDEAYEGAATLRRWIELIDQTYAGVEKHLVDRLVTLNDNVIDLEMGLPAWGAQTTALRMDLVVIEDRQVVFWEAKCAGDPRARCRNPGDMPEVVRQLEAYRAFLSEDANRLRVAEAYADAAAVLTSLRTLADRVGPTYALGREVAAAADTCALTVAREAGLVVIDENALTEGSGPGRRWLNWHANGHAAKLRSAVSMLVQTTPGRLRLADVD